MSASREHKRRRPLVTDYKRRLAYWRACEPPKWRFISHWIWENEKPKRTW